MILHFWIFSSSLLFSRTHALDSKRNDCAIFFDWDLTLGANNPPMGYHDFDAAYVGDDPTQWGKRRPMTEEQIIVINEKLAKLVQEQCTLFVITAGNADDLKKNKKINGISTTYLSPDKIHSTSEMEIVIWDTKDAISEMKTLQRLAKLKENFVKKHGKSYRGVFF